MQARHTGDTGEKARHLGDDGRGPRKIVCIEAALAQPAVAFLDRDRGVETEPLVLEGRRGRRGDLFRGIWEVLDRQGVAASAIEGLAVGLGPGSFTGVRVSLALAEGWRIAAGRGFSVAGLDAATLIASAAGVAMPHAVGLPIGRLRLLRVLAEPDGARADTARLIPVDALTEDSELRSEPLAVEPNTVRKFPWPPDVELVPAHQPPVSALAKAAQWGQLRWTEGPLDPAYLMAPDAVLPETGRVPGEVIRVGPERESGMQRLRSEASSVSLVVPEREPSRAEKPQDRALALVSHEGDVRAAIRLRPDRESGLARVVELLLGAEAPAEATSSLVRAAMVECRKAGWPRMQLRVPAGHADLLARLARLGLVPVSTEPVNDPSTGQAVVLGAVLDRA